MPDDKFIDEFISIANELNPELNTFLINSTNNPVYVKCKEKNVHLAGYGTEEFERIVGDLYNYKRVYIHFLTQDMCEFINKNGHKNTMFLWVFWGSDLYDHIPYPLLDETNLKYRKLHTRKLPHRIYWFMRSWRTKHRQHSERLKAIQRLEYILHFDENEYKLVLKFFPTQAKFHFFSYPNVLQFSHLDQPLDIDVLKAIDPDRSIDLSKKILLLGNSGYETGNHLSVLQNLADNRLYGYQIVAPLSYGNPEYIKHVISVGKRLLGRSFIPITNFFAPQTYSHLIKAAEAGIYNSRRTQGVGNIISFLYIGKRVFLNPISAVYHYFDRKGIVTNSIDQLFSKEVGPLDFASAENNREIIRNMYSVQTCKETIRKILILK